MSANDTPAIEPKIRGTICTNADPEGCNKHIDFQLAKVQAAYAEGSAQQAPKNVLVVGGSAGYGLASKIVALFGYQANVISVSLEKAPRGVRGGTAGYYNELRVDELAQAKGLSSQALTGDAFSYETKAQVAEQLKAQGQKVDLLVYSVAAPKRSVKRLDGSEDSYASCIKPIGEPLSGRSIDIVSEQIKSFEIEPAYDDDIAGTVGTMGGEDWFLWMDYLKQQDLLDASAKTVAFSYLGGDVTKDIYREGTLGKAKEDLEAYCEKINNLEVAGETNLDASVAVLKAIVTQSSAAIPSLSLYISALYKVMKANGDHEDCMDQIIRLFQTGLYQCGQQQADKDKPYRFRLDELELKPDTQAQVKTLIGEITEQNLNEVSDYQGFKADFLKLFGFGW